MRGQSGEILQEAVWTAEAAYINYLVFTTPATPISTLVYDDDNGQVWKSATFDGYCTHQPDLAV